MEIQQSSRQTLQVGIGAALTAGIVAQGDAALAQTQDEDAAVQGRVVVTGSRIKRADVEGALPVTVIDRAQIELSGQVSVADLMRNTNFNTFGSFRPQSGTTAQAFAGLSLRGLGEGRTLILVDGRRAPVSPNRGDAQDLNAIPLAAVERIEILSDGASAIYGSDAIGGVVNIITRKDYNGVELNYGQSSPIRPGGDTEEGSVIFGASSPNARVLGGASFNNRQIIWSRDREWSRGGASIFSNNFRAAIPHPGIAPGAHDPNDPAHWLVGGFLPHPANGSVVPGGCEGPGFSTVTAPFGPACVYDFTFVAADEADVRNQSLFTRAHFRINDAWATYMNASVSRVKSFGRYAPVPSTPWPVGQPFLGTDSPNHPANQGLAGYDPDTPLFFNHRFAALGSRDTTTEADNYDLLLGAEGTLGRVDLDFGVRQTEYEYIDLGRNYLVGTLAQQRIADGSYDIYDPFGNSPEILDGMSATTSRDARFLQRELFANASLDLFEMRGGVSTAVVGAEYRDEDYEDIFDSLSTANQVVGSAGNSAFGKRSAAAVYFEMLLPVTDALEVNLAGRYDHYSDYGSDFSPKLSMRWQLRPDLVLRASRGNGFKAPSLDVISQQPSFTAAGIAHPPTCIAQGLAPDCNTAVLTYIIGNPDIESETSKQYSVGLAWDAADWIDMSADYYDIKVDNRVIFIPPQAVVGCLEGTTSPCPAGLSDFSASLFNPPDSSRGMGAAFGPSGQVLFVQNGFGNIGTIETSGLDLNVRTRLQLGGWGQLNSQLMLTYVRSYTELDGPNTVGSVRRPQYRGVLSNTWEYGDFQLAWNVNYIHGTGSVAAERASVGLDDFGFPHQLSSWTTHDLQLSYHTRWNGRLTVGVRNLADKDPVVDPLQERGFDFNLYDGYGRVPYFRYQQAF